MTRVLVVDDSFAVRSMLRTVLLVRGYDVLEAADGQEALAAAIVRDDVVLLDVMMPGIDGFRVLRFLRARGEDAPQVIMLTAKAGDGDRAQAMAHGAAGYLTKPFDPDDVVAMIERAITVPVAPV